MTEDKKKKVCKKGMCEDCKGDECKNKCENGHICSDGKCGSSHECQGDECSECDTTSN